MRPQTAADDLKTFRRLLNLGDLPLASTYDAFLDAARSIFGLRTALIGSCVGEIYKVLRIHSDVPVPLTEATARPIHEVFSEEVWRTRVGASCHHISANEGMRAHALYREGAFEAYMAAPIRVGHEPFGVLSLLDPHPRSAPFSAAEGEFLQLIADALGRAIEQHRLRLRTREVDRQRQEVSALFETAFRDAPIGMALGDLEGRFIKANTAACALFGASEAEIIGKKFTTITHADDLTGELERVRALLCGEVPSFQMEKRYVRPSGEAVWAQINVTLVRFEDGAPRCFIGQIQDISVRHALEAQLDERQHELEAANAKLQTLASIDPLTSILNRRALRQKLEEEMGHARASGRPLGFVMLDVDHFKAYNDAHGHPAGDQALKGVANALKNSARASDAVGRFGGEEFLLLLPNAARREALEVAERARAAVAGSPELAWPLTVSAGVHVYDPASDPGDPAQRPERPITLADQALYMAKQRGRNRVEYL